MTQLALYFPNCSLGEGKTCPRRQRRRNGGRCTVTRAGIVRKLGQWPWCLGKLSHRLLCSAAVDLNSATISCRSSLRGRRTRKEERSSGIFLFFFETKTKFLFICFLLDYERGDCSFSARAVATFFRLPRFHFPRNRPPSEALLLESMQIDI